MKERNMRHGKKSKEEKKGKGQTRYEREPEETRKNQTALHLLGIEPTTPATPRHPLPHLPSPISYLLPPSTSTPA
jgi:hypothetical protein